MLTISSAVLQNLNVRSVKSPGDHVPATEMHSRVSSVMRLYLHRERPCVEKVIGKLNLQQ